MKNNHITSSNSFEDKGDALSKITKETSACQNDYAIINNSLTGTHRKKLNDNDDFTINSLIALKLRYLRAYARQHFFVLKLCSSSSIN